MDRSEGRHPQAGVALPHAVTIAPKSLTALTQLVKRFILLRTGFSGIRALESRSAVVQNCELTYVLVMKQKQEEISLNGLHV
jgi:hypothetical protein